MGKNIIIEALTKELTLLKKKEGKLREKLFANPLGEICQIRIEFQKIAKDKGISSQECIDYVSKYAKKEKELFKLADWQHDNMIKAGEELGNITFDISKLSNEIFMLEYRNKL